MIKLALYFLGLAFILNIFSCKSNIGMSRKESFSEFQLTPLLKSHKLRADSMNHAPGWKTDGFPKLLAWGQWTVDWGAIPDIELKIQPPENSLEAAVAANLAR